MAQMAESFDELREAYWKARKRRPGLGARLVEKGGSLVWLPDGAPQVAEKDRKRGWERLDDDEWRKYRGGKRGAPKNPWPPLLADALRSRAKEVLKSRPKTQRHKERMRSLHEVLYKSGTSLSTESVTRIVQYVVEDGASQGNRLTPKQRAWLDDVWARWRFCIHCRACHVDLGFVLCRECVAWLSHPSVTLDVPISSLQPEYESTGV